MTDREQVRRLYDWLSRFNLVMNWRRFGRLGADLTMHKTLRLPADVEASYGDAERCLYIVDRALDAAAVGDSPRVLDAGCGFGGTVFRWHEKVGGSYDGLTLSPVQCRVARREARRRHLEGSCRFHVRSYDDPPAGPFDAVVVIEALIHSPRFEHTLDRLVSVLEPGGVLVIVEDMAREGAAGDEDLEEMRRYWGLAAVPTAEDYRRSLAARGFRLRTQEDHSAGFETSPEEKLRRLEARYLKIRRRLPLAGVRFVADAFLGGLALERLYRKDLMRYRLMVARRESLEGGEAGDGVESRPSRTTTTRE